MKKKLLLLVAVFCFLGIGVKAQDVFHKGDIVANLQVGIGAHSNFNIAFPPTSLTVDFGAFDNLIQGKNGSVGIGAYVGMANYHNKKVIENVGIKENYFEMCFGVRGNFHYQFVEKLDTYAGIMLGLYADKYKYTEEFQGETLLTKASGVGFAHSEYIGARYYFSDEFAVNAELGYGMSFLSIGVSYKF